MSDASDLYDCHVEKRELKYDLIELQAKFGKALTFVKELAKDFPDRDDYRDCLKDEARELLMEIGELDESIKTD